MISAMDISTSALVAQRTRLNTIASNVANMSSVRNENGDVEPYQARFVVFREDQDVKMSSGATGVKVESIESESVEPNYKYQPGHPLAIKEARVKAMSPTRISTCRESSPMLSKRRVLTKPTSV